ncbi:hypothetical protein [Nesterenkonia sp. CF4.4]|uniref:hypothetical protein n=1 Tax=Nesterenkonia sp. CF4.4 TaxID=3373079 RepID=UPI003EE47D8D
MSTYTVNVDRDGTAWRIRVPEIARSTAARNLAEVEVMARDLISLVTDQEPDAFEIAINIEPPSPVRTIVEQAIEHRAQADEMNQLAAAEIREAAAQLRTRGVTARDTAQLLGVSPQRVSQLLSKPAKVKVGKVKVGSKVKVKVGSKVSAAPAVGMVPSGKLDRRDEKGKEDRREFKDEAKIAAKYR